MKIFSKGFTLIELMIAIAIVAILASIALPAYLDYTTRAKVSEGLLILDGMKLKIEEAYYVDGWVNTQVIGGVQTDKLGKYVDRATWQLDGGSVSPSSIYVRYSSNIAPVAQKCLGLVPLRNDAAINLADNSLAANNTRDKLSWVCKSAASAGATPIKYKYLPSNCRGDPYSTPTITTNGDVMCG